MIRRPPSSTLFPYTTLSLSRRFLTTGEAVPHTCRDGLHRSGFGRRTTEQGPSTAGGKPSVRLACRSEEHTSELKSRQYIVCRLLLEKKILLLLTTDLILIRD